LRAADKRQVIDALSAGNDMQRRAGEEADVETTGPEQRRYFFDRARARQFAGVESAVVESIGVDQRDRRLEDGHAPVEGALDGLSGIASLFASAS
jgi:hypothetical protein